MNYYLFGIFKNAPHPTRKTELSKLNPLQKLVYFGLKVILIPILVISGLLYMFYRYENNGEIMQLNIGKLDGIATAHTLGALLIIAFIIVHLYLITTGTSIFSNLKAMITGYEELEEEKDDVNNNQDKDIEQTKA